MKPSIAIILRNTLTGLGLSELIRKMMPGADICLFDGISDLRQADNGRFFHYFVPASLFLTDAPYFLARRHKTILLVDGNNAGHIPQDMHRLDMCRKEADLVRDLLRLARTAHGAPGNEPEPVRNAQAAPRHDEAALTRREQDVLRLIVTGLINKEIAERLHVSPTTVISHRKNIAEKLKTKNVAALTIYAVTHGLVKAEEI